MSTFSSPARCFHRRVNLPRVVSPSAVGSHVQEVSLEPHEPPRLLEITSREGRQLIVAADRPPSVASRVAPLETSTAAGTGLMERTLQVRD